MLSNYERVLLQMPERFLQYDQRPMCSRFAHDHDYFYLRMLRRPYRVSRAAGTVSWQTDFGRWMPAGFHEAMTIYDLLCCARPDRQLSGRFCRAENLPGAAHGANPARDLLAPFAAVCDRAPEQLAAACRALGGVPLPVGEVSFRLQLFDELPLMLQFWESDEEFPPELKLMWDENTLQFLKFETVWYAAAYLVERLTAWMEKRRIE